MAIETESKLTLPAHSIDRVKTLLTASGAQQLEKQRLLNWYFDTPGLQLSADKVALRIREQDGTYIQTLKTKGQSVNGLHQRAEWEWIIEKPELQLGLLMETDWPLVTQSKEWASDLHVIFETNFDRSIWMLERSGMLVEIALDQGDISYTSVAGDNYVDKICELELELKEGSVEQLVAITAELVAAIPELQPSDISKAQRGYQLYHQAI
ncbi:inorganic triphosphatase [Neptunomonas japonica]|uniref:Adenylate cyclase n=1 Tax=Neptunomonas japonica JAMM 1380 TaxID=1441457 RepID=A0A7R6PRJ5_9GAMM|nr:CYTH domain-containing protein [Neptunomonas japonica]BBB28213.1 adenylate cyclase [Neptunomonas japonica JAMM 1380]